MTMKAKNGKTSQDVKIQDVNFLYEVGCLRFVNRSWTQFLNHDFANVTEHIFRVVWLSLVIARYEKPVDTGKLIKMALVHDLSESRGVDVHYVSRLYAKRLDEAAITDMFQGTSLCEEFLALSKEYEDRVSLEAKIVKDADNLDVDFELAEQNAKGSSLKHDWQAMRDHVAELLFTQTAKKIYAQIQTTNPHDWHINAKNRINSGDWKK